ncbi:hypothetical protein M9Y10_013727 [Tritrichomonas musculus]|uniref:Uncharacterized protein n=1 Tax=Tritrichomonas musculus TaxID=1915356 RepID=A0ABR2KY70_9EUKA
MKQKYKFLLKHLPSDIESLSTSTSSKINEIRNSIIRCHRTVIFSRILFEEDKSIYGDYIPDASRLPSFVYNPKEIVPPKISPQLLQQTAYLFSFLHSNLPKLFDGMMSLLNKKDINSINESNFKKINSPTFYFLINSAIPSLFGYFSSKEYLSLAFSFYSHVIDLDSSFLTFKIIYPFFTAPWIFRYFESSLIPFFKSFSRDARVQQYFSSNEELKKKMRNKSDDFLNLTNTYANDLIDSFISNTPLLPQFFIAMIKMLGEKWNNKIIGNFLANELFRDMSFKFLTNFGYGDYREFLENVFFSIKNKIDLQVKLSIAFCSIKTTSFSSLEVPELFTFFGHRYINFICSIPEVLALEKAIKKVTTLPPSITGFTYETTPRFYLFLIKVFPKRYMPKRQKERNLIFKLDHAELPVNSDFERRYLQISTALVNQEQDLIQTLQKRQNNTKTSNTKENTKSNSNETTKDNSNETTKDNSNETTKDNSNETTKDNSNETTKDNSNETTKDNSNETTKDNSNKTTKDNSNETTKDNSNETTKSNSNETTKDNSNETTKDNSNETTKDNSNETTKDNSNETTKDNSNETTKDNSNETTKDNSNETTKDNSNETTKSNSNETTKDNSNETTKDNSNETTKDNSNETTKDNSNETTKDNSNETTKDNSNETTKDNSNETTKDNSNETTKSNSNETTKDNSNETTKDNSNETTKDNSNETTKDNSNETTKDNSNETTKDNSNETTKSNSNETTKDNSNETTKDNSNETTKDNSNETTKDNSNETTKDNSNETTKDNSNETTKDNSNETTKDNSNETTKDNSNETTKDNSNETTKDNSNETTKSNSNETKKNISANINNCGENSENLSLSLCDDSETVSESFLSTPYEFSKELHYEEDFVNYTLARCVDDLIFQAEAFEEIMLSTFKCSELLKWLEIAREHECVVMMPVANIAVKQAFMRGYEDVEVAFNHASSLFKGSTIIMKEQYLALLSLYIPQLARKTDIRWKEEMQKAGKSHAGSTSIVDWFLMKRRSRHLSFEERQAGKNIELVPKSSFMHNFSSNENINKTVNDSNSSNSNNLNCSTSSLKSEECNRVENGRSNSLDGNSSDSFNLNLNCTQNSTKSQTVFGSNAINISVNLIDNNDTSDSNLNNESSSEISTKNSNLNNESSSGISTKNSNLNNESSSGISTKNSNLNNESSSEISTKSSNLNNESSSEISTKNSNLNNESSSEISTKNSNLNNESSSEISTKNSNLNNESSSEISTKNSNLNNESSSEISTKNSNLNNESSSGISTSSSKDDLCHVSPLSQAPLSKLPATPPSHKSSFSFSPKSHAQVPTRAPSFSILLDLDTLESEWQKFISFLSLQFGRIDTGINSKYAGSIFFESVEMLRNVTMNNLSSSFKSVITAVTFLADLFESGMCSMDLIQMAIVLSDNKQLIRFYVIINAFAMRNLSFHKLCNEDEEFAWVKFEGAILKMISSEGNNELGRLFFQIQKKLLG